MLKAAVVPYGGVFVDPLAQGWLTGPAGGFVSPDGQQLTAAGHRYVADLVRPVLELALQAR